MSKKSMMKKPPGMVPRGRTIRLYPTLEQKQHLRLVQDEARHAWNHLVGQYNAKIRERYQRAEEAGVIGPKPERPVKGAPEVSWKDYWKEMSERRKLADAHSPDVRMPIPKTDAAAYKELWLEWETTGKPRRMTANMYQALLQDFARAMIPKKGGRWRPPRRRTDSDPMPIRTGTGYNVKPSGERHRNALVQLPGLGWISAIAHRDLDRMIGPTSLRSAASDCGLRASEARSLEPEALRIASEASFAPMVQGVAFTEHTDGWYAAVRVWVPEEQAGSAAGRQIIDDVAYVEIGLDTLCTVRVLTERSEVVRVWQNPRTSLVDVKLPKEGALPKIKRMPRGKFWEKGERVPNKWRESPERAATRRARHVGNLIDIICKFLAPYREIVLSSERPSTEGLPKNERGCPYATAPGRLWTALKNRFGDKIRWEGEEKAA